MKFLKSILSSSTAEEVAPAASSSFGNLTPRQMEEHLAVSRYGRFSLTDAVRPSFNLDVVPSAGYRRDTYKDAETGTEVPVLMAAQSREDLFDLFLDLLDPLGETVDVVLESSHQDGRRVDHYREHVDLPILKSMLLDFEELLTHDGCTGVAVLNPRTPLEVRFDEHKLLVMYGQNLLPFEEILFDHRLSHREELRFITEGEHVHSSTDEAAEEFSQMVYRFGIDDGPDDRVHGDESGDYAY